MQRIIYISTARHILNSDELADILRQSQSNNARVDVTGMLVVGGRRFLQVLEGPDHAVTSVFRRIEKDARHFAIVTLSRKPIADRMFPDWSMWYQVGDRAPETGALKDIVERMVRPIADPMIRTYFTEFAALHAAA